MTPEQRTRTRERIRTYADKVRTGLDKLDELSRVRGDTATLFIASSLRGLTLAIDELADLSEAQEGAE